MTRSIDERGSEQVHTDPDLPRILQNEMTSSSYVAVLIEDGSKENVSRCNSTSEHLPEQCSDVRIDGTHKSTLLMRSIGLRQSASLEVDSTNMRYLKCTITSVE